MSKRPVHYEPHPVSPARKAELIAQGYRIIDAKFRPADAPVEPAPTRAELDGYLAGLPAEYDAPEFVAPPQGNAAEEGETTAEPAPAARARPGRKPRGA